MPKSAPLLQTELFALRSEKVPERQRVILSYQRAREIARLYEFTASDIQYMSPKFWEFHSDDICALDVAAFSLLTIQFNLSAGTILAAANAVEHTVLLQKLLNFDVNVQYMLTELGHGLDAKNLETTATLLANGEFDLHTPTPEAAK
ncbi:hypothetical protein MY1884_006623 [Beauveria asiatica]